MTRALAVLALLLAAQAKPAIVEDVAFRAYPGGAARAVVSHRDGKVDFTVHNGYHAPITVTASIRPVHLTPDPGPILAIVPAGGSKVLARFDIRRPGWSYRWNYTWVFGTPEAYDDKTLYLKPFPHGGHFKVLQGFDGKFSHRDLKAIDWAMPEGTKVLAARDGTVVTYQDEARGGGLAPQYKADDAANYVLIHHADGTLGAYYHLRHRGVAVKPGQEVRAGDVIGYSGNTGYSSEPHLHFEVRAPREDGHGYRTLPVSVQP